MGSIRFSYTTHLVTLHGAIYRKIHEVHHTQVSITPASLKATYERKKSTAAHQRSVTLTTIDLPNGPVKLGE